MFIVPAIGDWLDLHNPACRKTLGGVRCLLRFCRVHDAMKM